MLLLLGNVRYLEAISKFDLKYLNGSVNPNFQSSLRRLGRGWDNDIDKKILVRMNDNDVVHSKIRSQRCERVFTRAR